MQPDKLHNFFVSTAERTIGINAHHVDDYASIINLIQSLPANVDNGFQIRTVTLKEVVQELRNIRSNCSTGPDNIPANMIKMVADYLGSPLTDIINTCIQKLYFPSAWKLARICAIPKGNQIKSEKDLRPISILPVLSKVYERLIFRQLSDFIDKNNVLNSNISAYRKGQSTTTVLQAIRDDIVKAMKSSEVTMMILADFSKAFDTICFRNLITKMSKLGFSRDFLILTLNYVVHRKQFVQIDDTSSDVKNVNFGVPQGSILGPVLFNIYVADLQDNVKVKYFQYADDTTIYDHAKISDLNSCRNTIYQSINKLSVWFQESTLDLTTTKPRL